MLAVYGENYLLIESGYYLYGLALENNNKIFRIDYQNYPRSRWDNKGIICSDVYDQFNYPTRVNDEQDDSYSNKPNINVLFNPRGLIAVCGLITTFLST